MKYNNIKKKYKKYFIGIQILRTLFSFHILLFHCLNYSSLKSIMIKKIIINVNIDLIMFFIISFYFSYNSLVSRNTILIKERINRLIIPYIVWPIIFYAIHIFANYKNSNQLIKAKYLYYQLIIGHGIHTVFWFQFNLIFLHIFFSIVILLNNTIYLLYLFLSGILCYLFIIKYNNKFFIKYNKIVAYSTRRIPFSYLYSLTGFFIHWINIEYEVNKYKMIIFFIFIILIALYIYFRKIFITFYSPIFINIFLSSSIFAIFLFIPFKVKNSNQYIYIIKYITNYTGGVYCLHTKIRDFYIKYIIQKKSLTIFECVINYLICYFICFICSKVFMNSNLKYLFI